MTPMVCDICACALLFSYFLHFFASHVFMSSTLCCFIRMNFFLWSGASRLRYSKFLEAIGLLASSASIFLLLCRFWHLCNCLIARYVLISLTIGSWWTKFEIQGHTPPPWKILKLQLIGEEKSQLVVSCQVMTNPNLSGCCSLPVTFYSFIPHLIGHETNNKTIKKFSLVFTV